MAHISGVVVAVDEAGLWVQLYIKHALNGIGEAKFSGDDDDDDNIAKLLLRCDPGCATPVFT